VIAVSAVIPCFNRAETIGEAVASVLAQTVPPCELLVVDDGSLDGSAEIAERAGARVIRMQANAGNAAARNIGIRAASGDAIAWLDSDDYWEKNHLATVLPLLDAYPDATVASAGVRFVGERSGIWYGDVPEGPPADVARQAFRSTVIPMITSVVRRDALLAIGGFDESNRRAVDFDVWLRLALRHRFVATRAVTAAYRWHSRQISATPEEQWYATYIFRQRALEEVRLRGDDALVAELSEVYRQRWASDLQDAWDNGRGAWLQRLLSLAPSVPGASRRLRWKWAIRSRIPLGALRIIRAAKARGVNIPIRFRSA